MTRSGVSWVREYPTSRSLDDLTGDFRVNMQRFHAALIDAGARVRIAATYRPPQRAYLMHWAFRIARRDFDPRQVPACEGVDIQWWHGDLRSSRAAANDMVEAYNIAFRPALRSNHTRGTAIDMTIRWRGPLLIADANGQGVVILTRPRSGQSRSLWQVGASYGVRKLARDRPHWSHNGR